MSNLFSSFDPRISTIYFKIGINWSSLIIFTIILPSIYWASQSQYTVSYNKILNHIETELSSLFGSLCLKGVIHIFISTFIFVILLNFIGLFPYVFTNTSHLVFTLSIALPMWIGPILWSFISQYNNLFAHLVPTGTPNILIPVIVVIETVRNIIRPGTLSIRLAANIVAGHLLLTLLGSQAANLRTMLLIGLIIGLILLIILECAVACIQSYVFTVLRSLYLNELLRTGFNKKIL